MPLSFSRVLARNNLLYFTNLSTIHFSKASFPVLSFPLSEKLCHYLSKHLFSQISQSLARVKVWLIFSHVKGSRNIFQVKGFPAFAKFKK
jgi:hypothetical protein